MVTGDVVEREHTEETALAEALKHGEAEMPGGRISIAREHVSPAPSSPFSTRELYKLDDALTFSSRETGLAFSVYLGELGDDSRRSADELHASIGEESTNAVLIAVSPSERKVEIVTGEHAHTRLADRSCKLAVMSMVASFKESDLVGGLVSGLRMLTEQAGPAHR